MSLAPEAQIRLATAEDLPRLVELLAQLSLDTPLEGTGEKPSDEHRRAFQEIANDARQRLFVLEAGGRIVGTACLVIVPNLSHQGAPYAIVENVVVDAASRGAGYGQLLIRHVMEEARSAGCYKLALTSNKQRPDAHRFYKRLGFRSTQKSFRIDF